MKLTRVVTDILGVNGRAVLTAIIAGETDPQRLADCTTGRLKASRADIVAAVHGRVTAHHRFLLQLHLTQIDALRAAVQKLEQQADEVLRPFRAVADRLTTMPGVSETVARVLIAEVGVDMTRFPTAGDALVEDGAGPGRVGGEPKERELSAGPIPAPQGPARPAEGHRGRCRFHVDRRLLHAPRRDRLP